MSTVIIHPSTIQGTLKSPPSKSCMQRACAAALLKNGETIIENFGISNDDNAAIEIIKQLGASVEISDEQLIINSNFSKLKLENILLNCGESGLSLRMFTPIAALLNEEITITGSGSLLNRPIDFFENILPHLGVKVEATNNQLPIKIKGSLQPKNIEIDGSLSSQFLTGLLFAYSYKNEDATIKVNNLRSKPYIDLTLQVLKDFGMNVPTNLKYETFIFQPTKQLTNKTINYTVEGDWSNAAFLLVAGAIAGSIAVTGLDSNSTQADKKILEVLKQCNCNVNISNNSITIANKNSLSAFNFDATDCPDLFPPLVALSSYCNGTSIISGVSRLLHKESNRAITLQQEFGKMGVEIILQDDEMLIKGTGEMKGATINSHNDHRIAMACAIAALKANGQTVIENANAIDKSYPGFYEDLKKNGAKISLK